MSKSSYFDYFSEFLPNYFEKLYSEISEKCKTYIIKTKYGETESNRLSCVVGNGEDFEYEREKEVYEWDECPTIEEIKKKVENKLKMEFDYCLVHLYRNGEDYISYHNDKEAIMTNIASLSIGASRKFRFRKMSTTKGFDYEYTLNDGDLIIMWGPRKNYPGCQSIYKHSVPIQKKIKDPRINLTFRQF